MRTARRTGWAVGAAILTMGVAAPTFAAAGTSSDAGSEARPETIGMEDSRLKFEINATDGDGGVQAFIDAEDWRVMSIYDPSGRRIFSADAKGRLAQHGGTELFLESGEPPFSELPLDQLLERWPEGDYEFRGRGVGGEFIVGSATLTHDLPDGPTLVSPIEGSAPQDPDATVVEWQSVPPPNGSPILGYEVIVEQSDTGITALPVVTLDVMMPPDATSLAVPPGFLRPGTEYEWEVLAIESSGNQTLSSSSFTTSNG